MGPGHKVGHTTGAQGRVPYKWKFSMDLYFKNFAGRGSIREIKCFTSIGKIWSIVVIRKIKICEIEMRAHS